MAPTACRTMLKCLERLRHSTPCATLASLRFMEWLSTRYAWPAVLALLSSACCSCLSVFCVLSLAFYMSSCNNLCHVVFGVRQAVSSPFLAFCCMLYLPCCLLSAVLALLSFVCCFCLAGFCSMFLLCFAHCLCCVAWQGVCLATLCNMFLLCFAHCLCCVA